VDSREQFEAWLESHDDEFNKASCDGLRSLGALVWQASRRAALEEAAQLCAKRSERAGTMGRAIEAIDLALAIRTLSTGDTNNG
jgi:hypothetical protein